MMRSRSAAPKWNRFALLFLLLGSEGSILAESARAAPSQRCIEKPRGLPVVVTEVQIIASNLRSDSKESKEKVAKDLAESWASFASCQAELGFVDWFPRHLEKRTAAAVLLATVDNSDMGQDVLIKFSVASRGGAPRRNPAWNVPVFPAHSNMSAGEKGRRWFTTFSPLLEKPLKVQADFRNTLLDVLTSISLNQSDAFLISESEPRLGLPILDADLCAKEGGKIRIEFDPDPPRYSGTIVATTPSLGVWIKDPPAWEFQAQVDVDFLGKPSSEIRDWSKIVSIFKSRKPDSARVKVTKYQWRYCDTSEKQAAKNN